ncbi:MAG TPA: DUF2780 domain-containing protein [Planctomycetota bacterium]|nr:DUF2780 domain-containing protein [Planctomycetota bacterium]HRR82997.1 DUF2780 domain-containing protein [Planctomycetota bacterium]HRT96851.1 DUF2780 domain-containing protein [Planctomycetota bacterium]
MDLIGTLKSQLGVTDDQAKGGLGALLRVAREKLGQAEFAKVEEQVPGAGQMADAAPRAEGSGGLAGALGGLAGALGSGSAGGLGKLAGLAAIFSKLGLDPAMIGKFVQTILAALQGKGAADARDALSSTLK